MKDVNATQSHSRTLVDLFAGCGGLSLGLESAGFVPQFVSELNADAMATYLANRTHHVGGEAFSQASELRCNDVAELTTSRLEKLRSDLRAAGTVEWARGGAKYSSLDLVAGGPPCQGFSGIGHRRSYSVDKKELPSNLLYLRMADVIRFLKPRVFLFENVRGILTSSWTRGGDDKIWPDVLGEFRRIEGYTVRWSLVQAKNYGVPQNRPRVLMVGLRDDWLADCTLVDPTADPEDAVKCGFLPPPRPDFPHLIDLLGDLVDPGIEDVLRSGDFPSGEFSTSRYPAAPRTPIQRSLRVGLAKKGAPLSEQVYSKHAPVIVKKFSHMLANDGEIPLEFRTRKFSQRVLPQRWGVSGPTITATSMPDDYVHFSQPRILTVREWARLQMFPDSYMFAGKRTTGGLRRAGNPREGNFDREVPKYTQIGNAVPVELAARVGAHFSMLLTSAGL